MSLDFYLCVPRSGRCPPRGFENVGSEERVYDDNITHNLTAMADALGVYQVLWRPNEAGVKYARDLIQPLRVAIRELEKRPRRYEHLSPQNGWGTIDSFLRFLRDVLQACEDHPDAEVRVST